MIYQYAPFSEVIVKTLHAKHRYLLLFVVIQATTMLHSVVYV